MGVFISKLPACRHYIIKRSIFLQFYTVLESVQKCALLRVKGIYKHAFTPQDKSLTLGHPHPHHIRKSPNMHRRVIEKRLRFQERKKDRDSAVSIGSSSTGPPSCQQSATDLTLHQSQDLVVVPTDSAVHAVAEHHQTRMSETPPDSPLGESGIGMSFQRFQARQNVDEHTDTDTLTH